MSELLVIREDGQHAWIPNEYEAIRSAIGNWIDLCGGYGPVSGFVDDEGMLNARQFNVVGSICVGRPVYGPIVLCHREVDDVGDTLPPDPGSAAAFMELGNIWQTVLAEASRLGQDLTVFADAATLPPPTIIELTNEQAEAFFTSGVLPTEPEA